MSAQMADGGLSRPRTLVVGLGNPLRGDDGVGPRVVKELLQRELPSHVEVVDAGSGGMDLLHLLEGRNLAVVVDAARWGGDSGEVKRFNPRQVELSPRTFSPHHASLAEVLALANALGYTLPQMVVFGVQPSKIEWESGLSPAVESAIPHLIDAILKEIMGAAPKGESDV